MKGNFGFGELSPESPRPKFSTPGEKLSKARFMLFLFHRNFGHLYDDAILVLLQSLGADAVDLHHVIGSLKRTELVTVIDNSCSDLLPDTAQRHQLLLGGGIDVDLQSLSGEYQGSGGKNSDKNESDNDTELNSFCLHVISPVIKLINFSSIG